MACSCEGEKEKHGEGKVQLKGVKAVEVDIFRDTLVRYLGRYSWVVNAVCFIMSVLLSHSLNGDTKLTK